MVPTQWSQADSSDPRSGHTLDIALTGGLPQLIAAEFKLVTVPNVEFGAGFGSFPINSFAHSIYSFPSIPLNLQTSDTYNLAPSGTFSLSSVYLFTRWYPMKAGLFFQLGFHSLNFSATISGALQDQTLGTSVPGVISGSVNINQTMINIGPGYQFVFGDHFHCDFGLGLAYLLPPSSSTSIGGSLASFSVLNSQATTNFNTAKSTLEADVNQAMAAYQSHLKFLPSLFISLGYIF